MMVNVTQDLAAELLHIISENADYRRRVDAISAALLRHTEPTARTALVIALASVEPPPARNWRPSR